MPIDPTGTSPEPVVTEEKPPTVNMRCKGSGCDSTTVIEIRLGNQSDRLYQCTKCRHTTNVSVGGHFPY
jgi:hypothetical protein